MSIFRRKPLLIGCAVFVALVVISIIGSSLIINQHHRYILESSQDIESALTAPPATAVILGAGVRADGTPNNILRNRLDAGIELFNSGAVERIIVSGYSPEEGYSEPQVMEDYLEANGVPEDVIQQDVGGYDTLATCQRAVTEFAVQQAVLVSQDSHIDRAIYLCRSVGLEAYGYRAKDVDRAVGQQWMRENFANIKAVIDIALLRLF